MYVVKNYMQITDNLATLLVYQNLDWDTIKELKTTFDTGIVNKSYDVKSNVAIAAAVTAYARIHMSQFKNNPLIDLYYTDTDSIIVGQELPTLLIGKELGLMKDELEGLTIKQAYFLGIKQYGYWYLDKNGQRIENSVFAGVSRNSLSFQEVKDVFFGKTIVKTVKSRFFRSSSSLNITIKDINISVNFKPNKVLLNNIYLPIKYKSNNSIYTRFINLINNFRKL